jgi:hypothetical protein
MPNRNTLARARRAEAEGKLPSTQAGEFVREEIEHIREGRLGARSTKQAIAIGLSKARRAGVKLQSSKKGTVSEETRHKAITDLESAASGGETRTSSKRTRATTAALKRESRSVVSKAALSRQAKTTGRQKHRSV